jgi:hypothetical protein
MIYIHTTMWRIATVLGLITGAFGFGTIRGAFKSEIGVDLADAMYATRMAGATYCPREDLLAWTCGHCVANLTRVEVISEDTQVVMGVDGSRCVVAFRGSSDTENWISNFEFAKTEPYPDPEVSVHHGLYDEYGDYKERVMEFLAVHAGDCDDIFVTGHSSGGALAMFFAYDLMLAGRPCTVYTLGKPRIGNDAFAQSIDESLLTHYRLTHAHDIVPHLPEVVLGFTHTSHEVWWPGDGVEKYVECDGSEDKQCSDSCAPLSCTSTDDHLTYLGVRLGNGGC